MCHHGLTRPIDGWDRDAFACVEGGGDERVEGELGAEGGVGEDGGGGGGFHDWVSDRLSRSGVQSRIDFFSRHTEEFTLRLLCCSHIFSSFVQNGCRLFKIVPESALLRAGVVDSMCCAQIGSCPFKTDSDTCSGCLLYTIP